MDLLLQNRNFEIIEMLISLTYLCLKATGLVENGSDISREGRDC